MRKRGAGRGINGGRRESIPYYIIYIGSNENGNRKSENGTDAGSESRSEIYFDYAEQQGGKDREAGLKRKTTYPLRALRSSP